MGVVGDFGQVVWRVKGVVFCGKLVEWIAIGGGRWVEGVGFRWFAALPGCEGCWFPEGLW